MTKRASIVVWGAVGGCAVLLLLASTFGGRAVACPLGQVCEPPCYLTTDCQVVGQEVRCQTHCTCPGGGTPGVTPMGTPFPWTPSPSPKPPPGGNVEWCLPYECAPGETRLWLVWYLYNLHIYQPVRPLELTGRAVALRRMASVSACTTIPRRSGGGDGAVTGTAGTTGAARPARLRLFHALHGQPTASLASHRRSSLLSHRHKDRNVTAPPPCLCVV